jgi:excisionase family DNA binding protein
MPLPELLDVTELGSVLLPYWPEKKRLRWIYRQVEERGMPALKVGRSLLFDAHAVELWLAAHSTNGGHDEQTNDGPPHDGPPDS